MRLILLCMSLTLLTSVSAEVYRTLDEDGNVIYTDKPSPDAEIIRIDEVQTISPPAVEDFEYTPPEKVTTDGGYTSLEIVSPENDQVFTGGAGNVSVSILIQPELNVESGDHLILYMDGEKKAESTSTSFSLTNIDRGTHTTRVDVVNKDAKPLKSTATVSFIVQRPSVLLPKPAPPSAP